MANTGVVSAQLDSDLISSAEKILTQLGISSSELIQRLYKQIVLENGVPFEDRLPSAKPLSMDRLTRDELSVEVLKGYEDMIAGDVYSADEVDAELFRLFGI